MNTSLDSSALEIFPQIGTTLPPLTQGSEKGFVQIICHCIMWKDNRLFNNHGEVAIRWWGESEPGIYLSPPTCNAGNLQEIEKKIPDIPQRHLVEVKYPIRCTRSALGKYFRDFGALPIVVNQVPNEDIEPIKVGETFVTLGKFMEGEPFLKRWFSVHDKDGVAVASVLFEMRVEHSDQDTSTEQKNEKNEQKNEKKNERKTKPLIQKNNVPSTNIQSNGKQTNSNLENKPKKEAQNIQTPPITVKKHPPSQIQKEEEQKENERKKPKGQLYKRPEKQITKPVDYNDLQISPIITRIQPQTRNDSKSIDPYKLDGKKSISALDDSIAPLKIPDSHEDIIENISKKSSPNHDIDIEIDNSYSNPIQNESSIQEITDRPSIDNNESKIKKDTQNKIKKQDYQIPTVQPTDDDNYLDYVLNNAANLAKGMNDFISNNRAQMYNPESASILHRPMDDFIYAPSSGEYINDGYKNFDENDIDDDFSASISSTSSLGDDNLLDDDELPSSILPRHQAGLLSYIPHNIPAYTPYQAPTRHYTNPLYPQQTYQQPNQQSSQQPTHPQNISQIPQSIRIDANVNINDRRKTPKRDSNRKNTSDVSNDSKVNDSYEEESMDHNKSDSREYESNTSEIISPPKHKIDAPIPIIKNFKGSPKEKFCFLVHISTGKLFENCRAVHLNLSCRLPFIKDGEKRSIFTFHNNDHSPLGIFHIYTIQPTDIDFFKEMDKRSFVIELSEAGGNYIGVATLSLTKFYNCFSEDFEWKPKNAVYGFNGELAATNPLTGKDVAEFRILTAFGTEAQIKELQQIILPPKRIVYELEGKPEVKKLSEIIPLSSFENESIKDKELLPITKSSENKKDINQKQKIDSPQTKANKFDKNKVKIQSKQRELSQTSLITVEIIRASGLQQAAKIAGRNNSNMDYASQNGVNPFVSFRIFDEHLYDDEFLVQSDFETTIVGRTFCPLWQFSKTYRFNFNEESYKFLEKGEAEFMVFHHFPKAVSDTMASNNILLGIAQVPLIELLIKKSGIRKWFNIYSLDGEEVGAIEIQITLDDTTKKILKLEADAESLEIDSTDDDDDDFIPALDMSPRMSYFPKDSKKSMCKITCMVEEISIPQDTLLKHTPEYTKLHHSLFECQYFLVYDQVNSSHIESRLYRASNSANHLTLKHSSEVTVPEDSILMSTLKEKILNIDLYVCIDTRNDDERYIRENAIFLGCAQIHLSRLYEKIQKERDNLLWISGIFPLINPNADSLKNGKMKIKIVFERLSDEVNVRDKLRSLKIEEGNQKSIAIDLEDEIRESLQSGYSVRSSVRRKAILNHTPAPIVRDDPSIVQRVINDESRPLASKKSSNQPDKFEKKRIEAIQEPIKKPINHLIITIHSALHLPSVQSKSSLKASPPSSYVSIISPNYEGDPPTMWKSIAKTPIIQKTNAPSWEFTYKLPIYDKINKLYFQVFHKYSDGTKERDILIGDVLVELDLLQFGCDFVEGWFLIVNPSSSKSSSASLNVTVKPEISFNAVNTSSLDVLSSSSVLLPDKEEEFVLHDDYSLQDSLHLTNLSPLDNYNFELAQNEVIQSKNNEAIEKHKPIITNIEKELEPFSSRIDLDESNTTELKSKLESCLKELENFSVLHSS